MVLKFRGECNKDRRVKVVSIYESSVLPCEKKVNKNREAHKTSIVNK